MIGAVHLLRRLPSGGLAIGTLALVGACATEAPPPAAAPAQAEAAAAAPTPNDATGVAVAPGYVGCSNDATAEKAMCPLPTDIIRVEDVSGGVRLHFTNPPRGAEAAMLCRQRAGSEPGYSNPNYCPLYIVGVTFTLTSDGALQITAGDPDVVRDIRQNARLLEGRETPEDAPAGTVQVGGGE